ncbi:DUF2332 domain-containing protein [Bacillus sp. ISL-39]|uniref:DUF2332 domain-containing protein n=1 Tax=Bacillus sp. ISL-39 TaxID=2819124 RepID=UPI001BE8B2F1|nr:DUF2332 domain-containing protein [Bacillus sp. ISL-39]MBT2636958.1 DUF2332 domain-containing protein [Bacillus sp. ISL-39]
MSNDLSMKFRRFAVHECRESSPLYEFLSLKIAEDGEMLELASSAKNGQPVPNLFFGAVHYLILKGFKHRLSAFYPSITNHPGKAENAYPAFVDFCQKYSYEIIGLLKNKIVQTNEVGRCSYLYPVFSHIYQITKKPLALLEIGTSAGLQLFMNQYSYSYGTGEIYGNPYSEVHLSSVIKGGKTLLQQMNHPEVATRIGIDLHINDVRNTEDYLWLKALIWPEHGERREIFEKAASYVSNQSLRLIEGDGVELIRSLATEIPEEQVICLFHTHVANQMPVETKEKLLEHIKEIGERRAIFHIYNNIYDAKLHLDYYLDGIESLNTIGETEGHGRWFSLEF